MGEAGTAPRAAMEPLNRLREMPTCEVSLHIAPRRTSFGTQSCGDSIVWDHVRLGGLDQVCEDSPEFDNLLEPFGSNCIQEFQPTGSVCWRLCHRPAKSLNSGPWGGSHEGASIGARHQLQRRHARCIPGKSSGSRSRHRKSPARFVSCRVGNNLHKAKWGGSGGSTPCFSA